MYRQRPGRPPIPHPLALTPFVLPHGAAREAAALARVVLRLHLAVPRLYREGVPELIMACGLEPRSRQWLDALPRETPAARMLLRIDVGFERDWTPVLFETNATGVAGFHYHDCAVSLFRELVAPVVGGGGLEGLADSPGLVDFFHRWLRDSCGGARRIGFVEAPPFGPGDTEMPRLAEALGRRGLLGVWGRPEELRARGGGFTLRGERIERLFRDISLKELPPPGSRSIAAFESMARRGLVVPGPAAEFDHKGMLECLSSSRFERLFSRSESRLLKRCVPWTRAVYERRTEGPHGGKVDLLPFLRRDPSRWVLKPNRSCGGEGVHLGGANISRWERLLGEACRRPGSWVVQERRETSRMTASVVRRGRVYSGKFYRSLGVFCGGSRIGFYGRVNPGPIVNVARGGALAPVFIERGRRPRP